MDLLNFPHSAYLVTSAAKELFDAVPPSSPITLTGTAPAVPFKCRVKVSVSGAHIDLVGHVYINAEDLNFISGVTTKQSTTLLTSIPVVTYSGLDCNILIECLDSGGAPVLDETLTPIKILYEYVESGFFLPSGVWTTYSGSYALVCNSTIDKNDIIRYNGEDLTVKKIEPLEIFGTEIYRILYF